VSFVNQDSTIFLDSICIRSSPSDTHQQNALILVQPEVHSSLQRECLLFTHVPVGKYVAWLSHRSPPLTSREKGIGIFDSARMVRSIIRTANSHIYSDDIDRDLDCSLEVRKVVHNFLVSQTPFPVLVELLLHLLLELLRCDYVDSNVDLVEAGI